VDAVPEPLTAGLLGLGLIGLGASGRGRYGAPDRPASTAGLPRARFLRRT
jgi:hypothetical protein